MKKILLVSILMIGTFLGISQNVPTAESILSAAYKQAAAENKNVFVMFHASWCGWCKKMDAAMNDATTKKYFDENYVTVHLTVQENPINKKMENPGAADFLKKFKGEDAGLPFFIVLDKKGKLLGDSFVNNENLGCPAAPEEVASFIILLKKSSKINEGGLQAIAARFKLNNPQQ
jgi:thioredoxin-related protein